MESICRQSTSIEHVQEMVYVLNYFPIVLQDIADDVLS